ncbi:Tbf5-domain-containing protein [Saitoella complicata NRRL Y-17804]|nr:Tbf5-domain-containing protein [Saitoella complicata NRRL Y-17804]ODQ52984.1 Tbf5-domain-containing protein [Saitoella complicata NRRL Y-17804]
MVRATKGLLISCDPTVKTIILQMDEERGNKLIVHDLDDDHVMIDRDMLDEVRARVEKQMEENTYNLQDRPDDGEKKRNGRFGTPGA